jgi:hypothetical protein
VKISVRSLVASESHWCEPDPSRDNRGGGRDDSAVDHGKTNSFLFFIFIKQTKKGTTVMSSTRDRKTPNRLFFLAGHKSGLKVSITLLIF